MLSSQTFDAYGYRRSTDGNTDPCCGFGGQSGYYTDWETGTAASALELLGLRYYDPQAGRFLTRDPASYGGGANLYEYCNDNSVGLSDPMGTSPIWTLLGGCLGTVVGLDTGENTDNCNTNYDLCLNVGDCIAEMAASAAGLALRASAGFILAGCMEGALSAGLHQLVEAGCRAKFQPCTPEDSPICKALSGVGDIVSGCIDGLIGKSMQLPGLGVYAQDAYEESISKVDGVIEGFLSTLGMGFESNCPELTAPFS